ncbi:hypothetical protein GmHk_12G034027 [Glycine max]|nr:hypothetical protein GmHk_12G034027 [Glycine max]
MSRSHPSSSRWTSLNEELEQLLTNVPKLTIEEHEELRKMANMMQNVAGLPETFFQTVHARDQIFSEVSKVYGVRWKDVLDGVLSPSRLILLSRKTFQAACIIFLKTKIELICTWRTLQNVGLCSIIGGRHLKFELDENIYAKLCL